MNGPRDRDRSTHLSNSLYMVISMDAYAKKSKESSGGTSDDCSRDEGGRDNKASDNGDCGGSSEG